MSICEGSNYAYIHWTENGKPERYKAKVPFFITTRTELIPTFKPNIGCRRVQLGLKGWRDCQPGGDRDSIMYPGFAVVGTPVNPRLQVSTPDQTLYPPGLLLEGYQGLGSIPSDIKKVYSYYRYEIKIIGTEIIGWANFKPICSNGSVEATVGIYDDRIQYFEDAIEGFYYRTRPCGIPSGGIVSAIDLSTGEELVESVNETCELIVYDGDMNPVFSRLIPGLCGSFDIQCEGDCPPGSCKCWISRAAKTFCCAKCRKG